MAHQFTDPFCNVNSASLSAYESTSGTITYSSAYQRFTPPTGCIGGGILLAANAFMRKNLSGNLSSLIAFVSFGANGFPTAGNQSAILAFLDNGNFQSGLLWTPSGQLQFARNGGALIGSASASGLIQSALKPINGLEIQITFSSSVGTIDCWLNGVHVITGTGLNTIQTANSYANQVQIGAVSGGSGNVFGSSNQGYYTDYLRVWDTTGGAQNTPAQIDVQPVTKLPSGAGSFSQFTPNGQPTNYLCVNNVPPSGSNYVSSSSAGIHDDYVVPVAGLTKAPTQVVALSYYQKTDGASRTYQNGVVSSGSVGSGSVFTANSGLTWVESCIVNDPNTGSPWTALGADAAHLYHIEVA